MNHEYPVDPGGSRIGCSGVPGARRTGDTLDLTTIAGHSPEALKIVDETGFDEGP